MVIALDPLAAPRTVNNFVFLARYHYYDGIVFHRIIPGFVLQGGDPDGTGTGGPGYRFADELPTPGRYQVGLAGHGQRRARTPTAASSSSSAGPTACACRRSYSLFGEVVSGLDVVAPSTPSARRSGTPTEQVVIEIGHHRGEGLTGPTDRRRPVSAG